MVLGFDQQRSQRILVIPPLFGEANKFRRQATEIMRLLDAIGVDSFCPDLPGCNESMQPHAEQTISRWRNAVSAAEEHFAATHVFAIRSGGWLAPKSLPGWLLAPPRPTQVLRSLLRGHVIALREAGVGADGGDILDNARRLGVTIAGWDLSPTLVCEMESETFEPAIGQEVIAQDRLGGPGLWLNAENQFDAEQAHTMVDIISAGLPLS